MGNVKKIPLGVIEAHPERDTGAIRLEFNQPVHGNYPEGKTLRAPACNLTAEAAGLDPVVWKVAVGLLKELSVMYIVLTDDPRTIVMGIAVPDDYQTTGMLEGAGILIASLRSQARLPKAETPLAMHNRLHNGLGSANLDWTDAYAHVLARVQEIVMESFDAVLDMHQPKPVMEEP